MHINIIAYWYKNRKTLEKEDITLADEEVTDTFQKMKTVSFLDSSIPESKDGVNIKQVRFRELEFRYK